MRVIFLQATVCRGMFWRSAGQAKWGAKSRMSNKVTQQGTGKRVSAKESWETKVTRTWPVHVCVNHCST